MNQYCYVILNNAGHSWTTLSAVDICDSPRAGCSGLTAAVARRLIHHSRDPHGGRLIATGALADSAGKGRRGEGWAGWAESEGVRPETTSTGTVMTAGGWKNLLRGFPWFEGEGRFPLPAYSEFMPPPRLGLEAVSATGAARSAACSTPNDPWGWHITEYEEHNELQPGLDQVARQVVGKTRPLAARRPATRRSPERLWPQSRTGRRLGGPGRQADATTVAWCCCRWRCRANPGRQGPRALDAVRRQRARPGQGVLEELLHRARQGSARRGGHRLSSASCSGRSTARQSTTSEDLHRAGFRILPDEERATRPFWDEGRCRRGRSRFCWTRRRRSQASSIC